VIVTVGYETTSSRQDVCEYAVANLDFQNATIEAFHTGNFAKVRYNCTYTIESVSMVDHIAAVWGDDACVETPKSGAPPQAWQGRWLTVYQLQPDGSWLIVRDSGEEAK